MSAANAGPAAAELIWDVRRALGEHGEKAVRLAYHAALPVVVDSGLLNLLRVNFFLDPPDDLPYEVEAELLMSPLFREVSEGLYEIEPELRNLLLTGLYSPPYGPDRVRRVAALLEQYTDATTAWRSLPALEAAQRLTAVSFLDPDLAGRWLDENEAGLAAAPADPDTASAGMRHEWYIAMRRRADERASVADFDTELFRAADLLDDPDMGQRLRGLRSIGMLAGLPGASLDQVLNLLCTFVSTRSFPAGLPSEMQEALTLLGTLPMHGVRLEDVAIRGVSLARLDFSGARFERVRLEEVNAAGVNLTGARLENCTLSSVVLDDALLDSAYCHFASMQAVSLQRASITGASITAERIEEVTATDPSGAQWQPGHPGQMIAQEVSEGAGGVTGPRDSERAAAGVPEVWGDVPLRDKNFTGRAEVMDRIREADLLIAYPVALQGLGGVGKTAIAVEYAHRYRADYDLVWWIPAEQPALVRSSLGALAGRLGLEAVGTSGIEGLVQVVLDALRRGEPYRRWLLIFDGANQPEEIMPLIPSGPGHVLITTRNYRWQSIVNTVAIIDVFSRAESTAFLMRRTPKKLTLRDADRLADRLGDLPLSLQQAGAAIAETRMSAQEYLQSLEENVTRVLDENELPGYPASMTAAWRLSVTAAERLMPQAGELLRLLAFFGPDPIPRDALRRGQTDGISAGVREVLDEPIMMAKAIRELSRLALISLHDRSITVHRLIQALLRDDLSADERDRYRHDVHLILAAAAPPDPDDLRGWPDYAVLVPHLTSPNVQLQGCQDERVRELALNAMRYLLTSGNREAFLVLAETCIEQWTADSGLASPDVARARRLLDEAR